MDTTIPLSYSSCTFETRIHLKIFSTLKHTQKKTPLYNFDDICIWITSMSFFFFFFVIEPTLKNWFLSNWFGLFDQGTKMTYEAHHKYKDKWKAKVYIHFPMKLKYREKGKKKRQ
jgi:hypothetical protein